MDWRMTGERFEFRRGIRRRPARHFRNLPQKKGKRGELNIHPALAPVSLVSACSAVGVTTLAYKLGGQNLAATCTTTGQNLTAVGGSHSLAETVNLGTMTLGGLVGTLHYVSPPIVFIFYMLDSQIGRSNT